MVSMRSARGVKLSPVGRTLDVLDDLTISRAGARARHLSYPLCRHCAKRCGRSEERALAESAGARCG